MTERLRQSVRAAMSTLTLYFCYMSFDLEVFPKYPIFHGDQWRQDREYTDSSFAEIGSARFFLVGIPKRFFKICKENFLRLQGESAIGGGEAVTFAPPNSLGEKQKRKASFAFSLALHYFCGRNKRRRILDFTTHPHPGRRTLSVVHSLLFVTKKREKTCKSSTYPRLREK